MIIAGSRALSGGYALELVKSAVRDSGFAITEVVSGGAYGVDSAGERWAKDNGKPCQVFYAQWNKHRKAAGVMRNTVMSEYADALIAIRGNNSRGTTDMINKMKRLGKPVFVVDVQGECQ